MYTQSWQSSFLLYGLTRGLWAGDSPGDCPAGDCPLPRVRPDAEHDRSQPDTEQVVDEQAD